MTVRCRAGRQSLITDDGAECPIIIVPGAKRADLNDSLSHARVILARMPEVADHEETGMPIPPESIGGIGS